MSSRKNNDKRPPTLRDLAAVAGVHVSTVSRALSGSTIISTAQKEKIQACARSLGYRVNPLYSALGEARRAKSVNQTKINLAFLTDREDFLPVRRLMHSLRTCAGRLGYSVESFALENYKADGKRVEQVLHARGIQGLLLGPLSVPMQTFAMDLSRFAVVELGFSYDLSPVHRVGFDHFAEMAEALHRTRAAGYRRPGLLITRQSHVRTRGRRLAAYLQWMREQELMTSFEPFRINEQEDAEFSAWLDKGKWDALLLAGISLEEAHLRMPETFRSRPGRKQRGLACFYPADETREPGMAGMVQPIDRLCETAMRILNGLLITNSRGLPEASEDTLIRSHWMGGESMPARASGKANRSSSSAAKTDGIRNE